MRVLFFHPYLKKVEIKNLLPFYHHKIDKLNKKYILYEDYTNNIEELEYLAYIRNYDVVFLFYDENMRYKYLNALKWIAKTQFNIAIYLITDKEKIGQQTFFEEELIKRYNLNRINYSEQKLLNHQTKLNEKFISIIESRINNISDRFNFDAESKSVYFINSAKERILIPLKKKIDFNTLHCFVLNIDRYLTIEKLCNFNTFEPEYAKDLTLELSLASVRKALKSISSSDEVKIISKKKIGYRLVY